MHSAPSLNNKFYIFQHLLAYVFFERSELTNCSAIWYNLFVQSEYDFFTLTSSILFILCCCVLLHCTASQYLIHWITLHSIVLYHNMHFINASNSVVLYCNMHFINSSNQNSTFWSRDHSLFFPYFIGQNIYFIDTNYINKIQTTRNGYTVYIKIIRSWKNIYYFPKSGHVMIILLIHLMSLHMVHCLNKHILL